MNSEYIEYLNENNINPVDVWKAQDLYIKGKSIKQILAIIKLTPANVEYLKSTLNWDELKRNKKEIITTNIDFTKDFILTLIKQGCPVIAAFAAIGLDKNQTEELLSKDNDFKSQILKIIAEKIVELTRKIEEFNESDWKSAAWLLEHHEDFRNSFKEKENNRGQILQIELLFKRGETSSQSNIISGEFSEISEIREISEN